MTVDPYRGLAFKAGKFSNVDDLLAVEESLSISVNDVPFTITMRTPGDEKELVRGILFSENIFRDIETIPEIEITGTNATGHITSVNVILPADLILKDFAGSRNVISVSSCGMCGKTSLDEFQNEKIISDAVLDPSAVSRMFEKVSALQKTFRQSGGTHAAGAFNINGELLTVHEDIGRHNAVDKVIGFLIYNNLLDDAVCITVSGRVSYEIVSKALSGGIPFVAAVSAPSSLAVDFAESSGITLMAFCRNDNLTVYSNTHRIVNESDAVNNHHANVEINVEKLK